MVRTLLHWYNNGPEVSNQTDTDLWEEAAYWFRRVEHACIGIIKVYSHQNMETATPIEEWAFRGNEVADRIASMAPRGYPLLVRMQQQLVEDLARTRLLQETRS